MNREDTYSLGVTVGDRDLGTWDKMSGGKLDSEETVYRPGGLKDQVSLGGTTKTDTVTVRKLYTREVHDLIKFLYGACGRRKMTIVKQPLDPDGVAYGKPIVYSGTLKSVMAPEVDSEGNSAALIELEMTVDGRPS